MSLSKQQTVLRAAVIAGTTPWLRAVIVNEDGEGFKPDTLTLTVYDVTVPERLASVFIGDPIRYLGYTEVTQAIVNSRDEVDVLAFCDNDGNVSMHLQTGDTDVEVLNTLVPSRTFRRFLFTFTWDTGSPDTTKVGKHEIILPIAADRSTVAT